MSRAWGVEEASCCSNAPVADSSLVSYCQPGGSTIEVLSSSPASCHCETGGNCSTAGTAGSHRA